MSSIDDEASKLEEIQRELSLQAQLGKGSPEPPHDWDGVTCSECGGDIVPARLALGFHTCIDCQEYIERHGR